MFIFFLILNDCLSAMADPEEEGESYATPHWHRPTAIFCPWKIPPLAYLQIRYFFENVVLHFANVWQTATIRSDFSTLNAQKRLAIAEGAYSAS